MELASPFTGQSLLTSSNKEYFDRRNRLGVDLLWRTHALSLFTVALEALPDFFHLLLETNPLSTQQINHVWVPLYLCNGKKVKFSCGCTGWPQLRSERVISDQAVLVFDPAA